MVLIISNCIKTYRVKFSQVEKGARFILYMNKKIVVWIAGILSLGGIYFLLVVPGYYLWCYFAEFTNPLRHEYLQGIALSGFMSAAFWLPVSILLVFAKSIVTRKLFIAGVAPIIILGALFLALNLSVII